MLNLLRIIAKGGRKCKTICHCSHSQDEQAIFYLHLTTSILFECFTIIELHLTQSDTCVKAFNAFNV